MNFLKAYPTLPMQKYVRYFWQLESSVACGISHTQRIIPHGLHEWWFYFHDLPTFSNTSISTSSHSFVSGMSNKPYDITIEGKMYIFAVTFQPLGLSSVLTIPSNNFLNVIEPLVNVVGREIYELEDGLNECQYFTDRTKLMEQFLLRILNKRESRSSQERMVHSISQLIDHSDVSILNLADNACLSRKQFERKFAEHIGTSPLQYKKIIRFQKAIHLMANPSLTFTQVACESGYYDQSHMNSEFYKYSGLSPKAFVAECEPYSDFFG